MNILDRKAVANSFLLLGFALVVVAIVARQVGLVDSGFKTRAIAAVFGVFFIAIGLLRARFGSVYTAGCVLVANTLLLLMFVEGTATVYTKWIERSQRAAADDVALGGPVERALYTGWKGVPSSNASVSVLDNGLRKTPVGPRTDRPPLRIFAFGGSTMWGEGAIDSETIPAHLQNLLADKIDCPVEVTNFGQRAWVSTQSLVQLNLELRRGNIPHIVVFYDGYNDSAAARMNGRVGIPESFGVVTGSESKKELGLRLMRKSALGKLVLSQADARFPESNPENLAHEVVEMYQAIQRIVLALSEEFGFESHFYWQPQLIVGKKPLSVAEQSIAADHPWLQKEIREITAITYEIVARESERLDYFTDISDVFETTEETVYFDPCHVTGQGNLLIARRMIEAGLLDAARRQYDRLRSKQ